MRPADSKWFFILLACATVANGGTWMQSSAGGVHTPSGPTSPTILWWKLNDGSGTAITADAGPDGTTDGSWSDGGLQLNGTSQEASTDSDVTYGSEVITISIWVQAPSWNHPERAYCLFSNNYGSNGSFFVFEQGGVFYIALRRSGGERRENLSVSGLSTGTWYHFAIVLDDSTSTGDVKFYIDGAEQSLSVDQNDKFGTGDIFTGVLFVGAGNASALWFEGKVDDLRIYDSELSSDDIDSIHDAGRE